MTIREFRDSEDCEQCPFKREGECIAGSPIEPPCTVWDYPDDTDMEDILEDYYKQILAFEKQEDRRIRAERKKQERTKKAAETRKAIDSYCHVEKSNVRLLERRIRAVECQERFACSLAEAFNFVNEAFHYKERHKPNPIFAEELKKLHTELDFARKKYEEKRAEFYAKRQYDRGE